MTMTMTEKQMNTLIAALKEIGARYIEAHPKPAKHWFFSGCHTLFYTHHNQTSAKKLTGLKDLLTEQDLLNQMVTLYNDIQKSAHLLPEIHACLRAHMPELDTRTKEVESELDYANPAGGEYTNWGLELPHYQKLINGYAENQSSVAQQKVNVTTELPTSTLPASTTLGFLSSCYALFCNFTYLSVNSRRELDIDNAML